MAHQSHAETLQSYAALAEIRDSLLETYASNDAMNQLLLAHLDPRAWRAQPPGQKGKGRTIAAIFAHLHNSRLTWLRNSAPHLKCPPPLDPHRCTMKQTAATHRRSAAQCLHMFSHEAHHRGQILLLAHLLGYRIPEPNIWPWDKLWKQAGLTTCPR